MRWTFLFFLIVSFIGSMNTVVQAAEKRNQLEELLIWKMSDELKLSATEEKKFTEIVQGLNLKKAGINHALQESVQKMEKASSLKSKNEELSRYRKALANYTRLNEEEFDKLKSLLGVERMVQYLYIKQDLTNRIKTMLTNPESGSNGRKTLPQPKLIEEK